MRRGAFIRCMRLLAGLRGKQPLEKVCETMPLEDHPLLKLLKADQQLALHRVDRLFGAAYHLDSPNG